MQRTSIAKKAVFYTKVAAAVLMFSAFMPLVSLAQERQAKAASAPMPAPSSKEKAAAVSFSKAQKFSGASQQKFDSTHPYAGVRVILAQLEAMPDSAQTYARKYAALVDEIADALQDSMGAGVTDNRQLLTMLWKIMQSRMLFAGDTRLISNSLFTGRWDCNNASTAAYDALKKLGFSPEAIILPDHFIIASQGLVLETQNGEIYPQDSLGSRYASPAKATPGMGAFMAYAYLERGNSDMDSSAFERAAGKAEKAASLGESAVMNYQRAISLNSNDPNSHANLGWAYECLGQYNNALREYAIAISISPNSGKARLNRANLYEKLGRFKDANADREAYYGVPGIKIINY